MAEVPLLFDDDAEEAEEARGRKNKQWPARSEAMTCVGVAATPMQQRRVWLV